MNGTMWSAFLTFVASAFLMTAASIVLTKSISALGVRWRVSESLLGIVAALAADTPEISAALIAIAMRQHDVGLGVVLGSNVFKLAGLLGVSALTVGRVHVGREASLFNGGVNVIATLVALMLILNWIPPWLALAVFLVLIGPYVLLSGLGSSPIQRLTLPAAVKAYLAKALERALGQTGQARPPGSIIALIASAALALAAVVASSDGAVRSAIALAGGLGRSGAIAGALIIGVLASVPNALEAALFSRARRDVAVVSTTFSSNTLTLLFGMLPAALLFGLGKPSPVILMSALWLMGMSVYALAAVSAPSGLRRREGLILVLLYVAFAAAFILWR